MAAEWMAARKATAGPRASPVYLSRLESLRWRDRRYFPFQAATGDERLTHHVTCLAMILAGCVTALGGPPFQTDDPEPIDFRHYECYVFGSSDGTAVETDTVAPAIEFNWGALPTRSCISSFPKPRCCPPTIPALRRQGPARGPSAWVTSRRVSSTAS